MAAPLAPNSVRRCVVPLSDGGPSCCQCASMLMACIGVALYPMCHVVNVAGYTAITCIMHLTNYKGGIQDLP